MKRLFFNEYEHFTVTANVPQTFWLPEPSPEKKILSQKKSPLHGGLKSPTQKNGRFYEVAEIVSKI